MVQVGAHAVAQTQGWGLAAGTLLAIEILYSLWAHAFVFSRPCLQLPDYSLYCSLIAMLPSMVKV